MSEAIRLRAINKIRANKPIPSPNGPTLLPCQSETINRFVDEGVASNAVNTLSSRLHYLHILRHLGLQFPKPYLELTKDDYVKYFSKPMATNTKRGKIRIIKRFTRYLYDLPQRTYPKCISWIGNPPKAVTRTTAADLLTEEEILALFRFADVQSRARIGILFDTAGRNHEVFYLRKSDVQKADFSVRGKITPGYRITLKNNPDSITKGGVFGNRTVPLIKSHVYLTNWFNEHPTWKEVHNPPLWVNKFNGEELECEADFCKKLKRIAKKAGITKNVHPHIFRHTKLTDMARTRMTESAMRKFAGWSPTSNMPAVYVHLSGVHMEGEALRSAGADVPEEKPMFDQNKICPQCGNENEIHATYCVLCSSSLDEKDYVDEKTKEIAKALKEHEGMKEQLIKVLQQKTA